jgi:hypothetical protein
LNGIQTLVEYSIERLAAMLNTVELLELAKQKHNLPSDYALAKALDVSPGLICKHRKKPFGMDGMLALKVARMADLLPEYVLICAAAERAKCTEEKDAWLRLGAWADLRYSELKQGFLMAAEPVPPYV